MNRGHIEQLGPPQELYERPATAFVAGFLGVSNLLRGVVEGPGAVRLEDGTLVHADADGRSGPVAVGVRPEKVTIGAGGGSNQITGTVSETAYIGVATQIVVRTRLGEVHVFAQNIDPRASMPAPRAEVTLTWSPEATFVVDRDESAEGKETEG
jgi:spermidine/putrescine transport system ATP-binding protein